MATAAHIELSTGEAGVFHVSDISKSSAAKASEVLQVNHDKNHCFFNNEGFHNHIPHHILTIFALGANSQDIQKAFDNNAEYQRSKELEEREIVDMNDRKAFLKHLGDENYYIDYLQFFQSELGKKGIGQTIQDQVFAEDEAAKTMLGQLFAGFLHPIIHAGFGIEFEQPAIVAEGLAMAAVSSSWMNKYFDLVREKISSNSGPPSTKTLFDLCTEIQSNEKLAHCAKWEDSNKVRDGVLARAPDEMVSIASQWQVSPDNHDEIERKTAEMINFAAYFTAAAQNPKKRIIMDFYFMHCINSSIFWSAFLRKPWLSDAQRATLLEMKGWLDLAMYVSRYTPDLNIAEIKNYKPKSSKSSWQDVFNRVDKFEDDGHCSKFIRAVANGERVCKPYEEREGWLIQGDMWLQIANMVIDSVESGTPHWGRSVGFPEAWKDIPARL